MSTWRLLNDEKPTRAMICLEKKICGYTSITRINKANTNYNPTKGDNKVTNPKKILLTDRAEVRKSTINRNISPQKKSMWNLF